MPEILIVVFTVFIILACEGDVFLVLIKLVPVPHCIFLSCKDFENVKYDNVFLKSIKDTQVCPRVQESGCWEIILAQLEIIANSFWRQGLEFDCNKKLRLSEVRDPS